MKRITFVSGDLLDLIRFYIKGKEESMKRKLGGKSWHSWIYLHRSSITQQPLLLKSISKKEDKKRHEKKNPSREPEVECTGNPPGKSPFWILFKNCIHDAFVIVIQQIRPSTADELTAHRCAPTDVMHMIYSHFLDVRGQLKALV